MKNKIIILLMASTISVGMLVGCGSKAATDNTTDVVASVSSTEAASAAETSTSDASSEAPSDAAVVENSDSEKVNEVIPDTEAIDAEDLAGKKAPESSSDIEVSGVELTAEEIEALKSEDGMDKATAKELGYDIAFEGYFPENNEYIYWFSSTTSDKGLMYIKRPNGEYFRFKGKLENLSNGGMVQHSDDDNVKYYWKCFESMRTADNKETFYCEDAEGRYCWLFQVDPNQCMNDFYNNSLSY